MIDLSHVRAWVFDMDDTLYPREQGLMGLVQARINAYVVEAVGLDPDSARVLQRQFLDEHGTTLAGLMANYTVDADHFLHDVHDVPMDSLEPNPRLADQLMRLPGRRYVFTNGARDYAGRVLDRLGVAQCFDGVADLAVGRGREAGPVFPGGLDDRFQMRDVGHAAASLKVRSVRKSRRSGAMWSMWSPSGLPWPSPIRTVVMPSALAGSRLRGVSSKKAA